MTVSDETESNILRYFYAEKWRIGTIAYQLGVHHSVVRRVLSQSGCSKVKQSKRESLLDAYLPFVLETLNKFPRITASRLYDMVCERGYAGGPDHFRHLMALHRPRPHAEAYHRLRTLPGEQGQVDWGHFGHIMIGKAKRPLMAFVMVLSYSRKIFLRFYLNQQLANFLRGHEAAFAAWQGIPRVLLYDNLRSAVLERQGDAIRFNPDLLKFSGYYRFEPRPVAVARGNEKGRVERAIRYIRDNFFPGREWDNLDELNHQATLWCDGRAQDRPCPEDRTLTVRETFEQERPTLLPLPDNPYPTDEREEISVGKTPYVRFDLNDYSIPHTHVRRVLTVNASLERVQILDGIEIIAEHARSYDKGKQREQESHIEALTAAKRKARHQRGKDRLISAIPITKELLIKAAENGYNLGNITSTFLLLLDTYGTSELEIAIKEALLNGSSHPNSVRLILERRREERNQPPPIKIDLPNDRRVQEHVVRPHSLDTYDQLEK